MDLTKTKAAVAKSRKTAFPLEIDVDEEDTAETHSRSGGSKDVDSDPPAKGTRSATKQARTEAVPASKARTSTKKARRAK